jgi:hypothetical protein
MLGTSVNGVVAGEEAEEGVVLRGHDVRGEEERGARTVC